MQDNFLPYRAKTDDFRFFHEWVEGYLCLRERYPNGYIGKGIQIPDKYGHATIPPITVDVNEETISKNTGMCDKNNTPIWENDIVSGLFHGRMPINGVVQFQNESFGLQWYRETDFDTIEEFTPFSSMCNVELEVLGNKFDNPELLEQEFLQSSLSI